MGDVAVRLATAEDAAAICEIYNQGIDDRIATLETERRTPEERRQWLAARSSRHPVIVAEAAESAPIAWASLNPFNPRRAYDHVADISVYVERGWRGRGVGRRLLERLVELQAHEGCLDQARGSPGTRFAHPRRDEVVGQRPQPHLVRLGDHRREGFSPEHTHRGGLDVEPLASSLVR